MACTLLVSGATVADGDVKQPAIPMAALPFCFTDKVRLLPNETIERIGFPVSITTITNSGGSITVNCPYANCVYSIAAAGIFHSQANELSVPLACTTSTLYRPYFAHLESGMGWGRSWCFSPTTESIPLNLFFDPAAVQVRALQLRLPRARVGLAEGVLLPSGTPYCYIGALVRDA